MQLTDRDQQIVLAIYEHRLLSAHQIEALFFPSSSPQSHSRRTACQRRLQLLYHHGFLACLPQPVVLGEGRVPFVYALDEAGAYLVATLLGVDSGEVNWKPKHNQISTQFLDHTLAINDVRVVLQQLVRRGHLELGQWVDEGALKSAERQEAVPYMMQGARVVRKYPDGYFTLVVNDRQAYFFLEVDRGTESNVRWQEKIKAYHEFRESGESQRHYSTRNFRVLTVTTSDQRLQNLKKATEKAEGDHYFWFTIQERIDIWQPGCFLEPIWSIATKPDKLSLFN